MKSASIFPVALMLATTSLFGQGPMSPKRIDPSKCPVELQAERSAGLFAYKNVKWGPADEGVSPASQQRLEFTIVNFLPHEIVKAEITVHGFSYKGRFLSLANPTPDLAKTLPVALEVKGNSSASRELSFDHFSTIKTIDLNAITYADGSTWHASSPGACSVAPSLVMRLRAD
jgi:hypothetical protein